MTNDPSIPRTPTDMRYRVGARTNLGRCRDRNEDALLVRDLGPGLIVGVFDGCGSTPDGFAASHMAVRELEAALVEGSAYRSIDDLAARVDVALEQTARVLWNYLRSGDTMRGMGTTATVGVLCGRRLRGAHVGDSRLYLFRDGTLRQLSRDDTLLQDVLDRGAATQAELADVPRNVIMKAIGMAPTITHSTFCCDLFPGDRIVLTTDGVSTMLDHETMVRVISHQADSVGACDALIDAAEAAGGHDNETVIVVECH